jgi:excisionase family DNA binding protein
MEMLSYEDAAHLLGLPVGTIYSMVSKRQIPHVRLGPRLVRFERSALEAWRNARRVMPRQPEVDR